MDRSFVVTLTLSTLLAVVGCGPPRLASSPEDEESDSAEAGSDSTSSSETSTSSTSAETSDDTSESPSSGSEFVVRDDVWMADQCDQFEQDCPEGEKCVPYSTDGGPWNANKCVPVIGDAEPGESCWWGGIMEATDDCDATSICWDVMEFGGELIGTCVALCTGTPDTPECPSGSSCLIGGDSTVAICISDCDPLLQDCSSGLGCYWTGGDFKCVHTTDDLPTGAPCGFINDCAPGHLCGPAESLPSCEGAACCTPLCDLEVGDEHCQTMPGTSCVPFFQDGTAPPGYELVGVCVTSP